MNSTDNRSAGTAKRVFLAVLVVVLVGLIAWRGMKYWEGHRAYWLGCSPSNSPAANRTPPSGPPIVYSPAEPVFENLRVNVRGAPEALKSCRVWARFGNGSFAEATRAGEDRYFFSGRLTLGSLVVAVAPMATRTDASGKEIPQADVSETVELTAASPKTLELHLKPTHCLTADVRSPAGQVVPDASVSVDFVGEQAPFQWLNVLHLSGIESLESWLRGNAQNAPQIPLLREGTHLRLTAESKGRFGATKPLEVMRSETVQIVLGAEVSFADIEIRDSIGGVVANLALAYHVSGRNSKSPLRTGASQTDASGKARISGGEGESSLEIWVIADDYYLPGRSVKVPLDGAAHAVTVCAAVAVKLDIRFEDDQQYTGPLSVWSVPPGTFSRAYSAPGVDQDYSGPRGSRPQPDPLGLYEVRGVPRDLDLLCTAAPSRAGFWMLNARVSKSELVPNGRYTLRIPRATAKQPSAKIVFRGDFDKLKDAQARLVPINSPFGVDGPYRLQIQRETHLLMPGEYRVEVTGKNTAWQSDVITITADETRYVDVPQVAPASVAATIVDQDGKSLRGAALCRSASSVDFPARPTPWLAVSDESGGAVLGGCPEGRVELRIEADGFESEVVTATLISGVITDIGSIRLQPARGEIRVKIKNFDRIAKLNPRIDLATWEQGKGSGDRARDSLVSDTYVFQRLPLGKRYDVIIRPPNGKSWHIVNLLRPTEARPIVEVEVDAAEFKLEE